MPTEFLSVLDVILKVKDQRENFEIKYEICFDITSGTSQPPAIKTSDSSHLKLK